MHMTEAEIRMRYRDARLKTKQIGILADLNNCTSNQIKNILGIKSKPHRQGYQAGESIADQFANEIREWRENGMSYAKIAGRLEMSTTTIVRHCQENRIYPNDMNSKIWRER